MTTPRAAALVLGIAALLSVIPAVVALVRARKHGDWELTSTLVFLVGALGILPAVTYVLVAGRPQRLDAFGDVVADLPGWVNRIGQLTNAALLGAGVLFVFLRLAGGRAKVNVAPLIALLLALLLAFSDGLDGRQLFAPRQLALLAVLLAASVARPGRPAFLGAAAVAVLLTLVSGIEALVAPDHVFRVCRTDKCSPFGALYTGVLTNENIFSLLLVVCIPFIWMAVRGRVRLLLACYVAFVVIATGSRSGEVAAIATLLLLVLMRPKLPEGTERPRHTPAAIVAGGVLSLCAVAFAGLLLPFTVAAGGGLGGRAYIWSVAGEQLSRSPFIGFGANAWTAASPQYGVPKALTPTLHNEWIDVLFAGGLIGLSLLALLLAYILLRGGRANVAVACCVLLPVLLNAALERPWSFGISDSLSFALVAATLVPGAVVLRPAGSPAAAESLPRPVAVPARTPGH
ncbi:O-antigen ligase family protein [Streptomyces sp. NPDC048441]|uniref:O-antigen ligase family protein n=1 Tax=Streptomyces sp. NPDC048441 TaxID=3365552 RepID=UPI0037247A0A